MKQQQYQDEFNKNDPFMEYVDSLPDPQIEVSEQFEQDVRNYEVRKEEDKKKTRFRVVTFVIAAVAALAVNFLLKSIPAPEPDVQQNTYPIWHENHPERIVECEPGDGVLNSDLNVPEIMIDGNYYHLPFRVSELLDNGWEIDPFYADQQADYYTNYISLTKGDEKLRTVAVISADGDPVSMDQAVVTGLDVYGWDEGEVRLPGGISAGITTEDELIQAMRDSGLSWSYKEFGQDGAASLKYYKYFAPAENEAFTYYTVEFCVNRDGKVISLDIFLVDYNHPLGIEDAVNT